MNGRKDIHRHNEQATMPHDLAGLNERPVFIAPASAAGTDARDPASLIRPLAEIERVAIEDAIRICRGNIPMAAVYLGLSPSTLYRKRAAWIDGATASESRD